MTFESTDSTDAGDERSTHVNAARPQALSNLLEQLDHISGTASGSLAWEDDTWKVDFWRQCVSGPSGTVRMNVAELIIFGRLLAADGRVLEKSEFHAHLMRLWDAGEAQGVDSRLKLNISRMRAKFAKARVRFPVRSVHGVGYQLIRLD